MHYVMALLILPGDDDNHSDLVFKSMRTTAPEASSTVEREHKLPKIFCRQIKVGKNRLGFFPQINLNSKTDARLSDF